MSAGNDKARLRIFRQDAVAVVRKRLQLAVQSSRELLASFRFDGSTCSNMGVPLVIDYHVYLERDGGNGYRITRSFCQPADNDIGYRSTCAYLENPARHMAQIESYQPFVGRSLHEVLAWNPPVSSAGCLCTHAHEDHKWRIVLQTIHFALESHE